MQGLTIFGITGRMGQSLLRALREGEASGTWQLVGAVASPQSSRLGEDAGGEGAPLGVTISANPAAALTGAVTAVDFSRPEFVAAHAAACVASGVPLLVGTTGFDAVTRAALGTAAARIPVLIAPTSGVGVNVLARLVELAATALGPDWDVEIIETHHRMKRDAPSGTALALGDAVARTRGVALADIAVIEGRGAAVPRARGTVGFSVVRAGDVVGEHTVMFAAEGERVEITHRAADRIVFARGALRAAAWLAGRAPGLYGMSDVLGL